MRPRTLATLAAVALPMLAAPAIAQDARDDGYAYHWNDSVSRPYADDRRGERPGPQDGPDAAYHVPYGYGYDARYRDHHGVGPSADRPRAEVYAERAYRGHEDPDFRQDGRRGYYQDSAYEQMPHDRRGVRDDPRRRVDGQGGYHMAEAARGQRHGGRGARRMHRLEQMVETYDSDGDGRVTQEEVDTYRSERVGRFDSDGDGALTLEEYQALWLDAMRERMVDRFQYHDDDGDGRVTVDEFSSRTGNLVRARDRDGDGAVSYGDLGPRGGQEFRRMHGDRIENDDLTRPEVEAPLGGEPNQPAGPAAGEDDEDEDGGTN